MSNKIQNLIKFINPIHQKTFFKLLSVVSMAKSNFLIKKIRFVNRESMELMESMEKLFSIRKKVKFQLMFLTIFRFEFFLRIIFSEEIYQIYEEIKRQKL